MVGESGLFHDGTLRKHLVRCRTGCLMTGTHLTQAPDLPDNSLAGPKQLQCTAGSEMA